ncbi:MAG: prepilin-type N-terminal cleavage/methylation domain-containing protein [bacterium]
MTQRGFTLIELLIVVAIIGILAAIAVPNFMNARMRAQVSRAVADERNLATALESYRIDNNRYPSASEENGTTRVTVFQRWAKLTTPVSYMPAVPFDPFFRADIQPPALWGGPVYNYFERESSQLTTAAWGPTSVEKNAVYFIHSFGPDGENSSITTEGYYTHVRYDLSNGVNSIGDIIRYGP